MGHARKGTKGGLREEVMGIVLCVPQHASLLNCEVDIPVLTGPNTQSSQG